MNPDKVESRWLEYKENSEYIKMLEERVRSISEIYVSGYRAGHADGVAESTTKRSEQEAETWPKQ